MSRKLKPHAPAEPGIRPDILDRPFTVIEVSGHLAAIAKQRPDATVYFRDEAGCSYPLNMVSYDADSNSVVFELIANI